MSDSIYLRAKARESMIWTNFLYGIACSDEIESDKVIIFGLYSGTYKYGHNYLEDIESEELQRLVDEYDNNMSQLDADDQILVLQIAAKRYLNNLDILISKEKVNTKYRKLEYEEEKLTDELAALEVDREALDTMQYKIDIAETNAENRIKELEALISLEVVNGEYVDLEITEKQLEAARAELQVLTTAIRGLEIQASIADLGYRIREAEVTKSELKVSIAELDARIADSELAEERYNIELAKETATTYEINNLYPAKEELIDKEGDNIQAEINDLVIEEGKRLELHTKELEKEDASKSYASAKLSNEVQIHLSKAGFITAGNVLKRTLAEYDKISEIVVSGYRNNINLTRREVARQRMNRAIDLAEELAAANITAKLVHTISSSE